MSRETRRLSLRVTSFQARLDWVTLWMIIGEIHPTLAKTCETMRVFFLLMVVQVKGWLITVDGLDQTMSYAVIDRGNRNCFHCLGFTWFSRSFIRAGLPRKALCSQ